MRNLALTAAALLLTCVMPTAASAAGGVDCQMRFSMQSWSLAYKRAEGNGTITCSNGQVMNVRLKARGGGLTVGKSSIDDGRGEFSGVKDISEVVGTYASAEASAAAVKGAKGQVVTKGEVSLALAGTGRGWDLGIAFGKFVISRSR